MLRHLGNELFFGRLNSENVLKMDLLMQQTATSYLVLDDDHWNLGEIRRSGKPSQTPVA
jgi:hypothetical protein